MSNLNYDVAQEKCPDGYKWIYHPGNGALCFSRYEDSGRFISIDFESGENIHRLKTFGKSQPLAKSIGAAKGVSVIADLTAGLGGDSFAIASLGINVHAIERNRIVFLLLNDALERARKSTLLVKTNHNNSTLLSEIANRIQLHNASAFEFLKSYDLSTIETLYMDPMYPDLKSKALPKKEMQWLDVIVGDDEDQKSLLEAAIATSVNRVTVKRPKRAEPLLVPSHSLEGNTTRYDVYLK